MSATRTPVSGHTPLPWTYDPVDDAGWGFVRGPDGMPVARTDMSARYELSDIGKLAPPPEISANAALIVRAVNEREELIAVLNDLWLWASESRTHLTTDPVPDGLGAAVLAVLAKADTP